MKSPPIIFQDWGVRGILDGTKTVTRRVIKPQPIQTTPGCLEWKGEHYFDAESSFHMWALDHCPYGVPGARLWVRETWGCPDADHPRCKNGRKPQKGDRVVYRAKPADKYQWGSGLPSQGSFCWRPSIHMPRWASRLTLENLGPSVERVQEITEEEAIAEGCSDDWGYVGSPFEPREMDGHTAMDDFAAAWDSIHAAPKPVRCNGKIDHYVSYPWEDITETREHRGLPWYVWGNPWVWRVPFRREE